MPRRHHTTGGTDWISLPLLVWPVYRQGLVGLVFALVLGVAWSSASLAQDDRFNGTVILIRHALAPGTGDPAQFDLKDCRTQRNLDETGRRQARAIGMQLQAAAVEFAAVYSSEWCRCLETAQLLGLGPVTPFHGLNSFYEGHAPRAATLAALDAKIASLPKDGKPIVMVTHFVTISALTNLAVSSGGMVLLDLGTGTAREITPAAFAASTGG
jgi:broad specificity phosphatase PhoE